MTMQTEQEAPTTALARIVQPLEPSKAAIVRAGFEAMFCQLDEWHQDTARIAAKDPSEPGTRKRAEVVRKEIKASRVALDKKRKEMKEGILKEGRAIDGAYAIFESMASPLEKTLLDVEKYAERQEAARRDALRDARKAALLALDVAEAALPAALGEMTEEAWQVTHDDALAAKETRARIAREEEEARVEAARILAEKRAAEETARKAAEAARLVREEEQRAENGRLAAEVEAERAKAAEEHRRAEEAAREARHVAEQARLAARREAARKLAEVEEKAAQERQKAYEAEQEAGRLRQAEEDRLAKEEQARIDALAQVEAAALAPDRDKLVAYAALLAAVPAPTLGSEKGRKLSAQIVSGLAKLVTSIEGAARKL
jgi:hypothetical protein